MSDTDYFDLNTKETYALAMEFSKDGKLLAIYGRDLKIRVFNFKTGILLRLIDETFELLEKVQESEDPRYQLLQVEEKDKENRKLVEKDVEKQWDLSTKEITSQIIPSMAFDETDTYLCYSSPIGIKVHNLKTNTLSRILGKDEQQERFIAV